MTKPGRPKDKASAARSAGGSFGATKARFADRAGEGKCVLCGLCVRACKAVLGQSVIRVSKREDGERVIAALANAPESCTGCQACVRICPTGGYIVSSDDGLIRRLETWNAELKLVPCSECGIPFATIRELALARSKVANSLLVDTICPSCRRSRAAARLAKAQAT